MPPSSPHRPRLIGLRAAGASCLLVQALTSHAPLSFAAQTPAASSSAAHPHPAPTPAPLLPFRSDETPTSGSLVISFSHDFTFNPRKGRAAWRELSVDAGGLVNVSLEPGSWDAATTAAQTLRARIGVRDGAIDGEYTVREDASWTGGGAVRLGARDADWLTPPVAVRGFSIDASGVFDSRLTEGPLPQLRAAEVAPMRIDSIEAGPYKVSDITARLMWNRPNWTVETMSADVFGGRISMNGQGIWGTSADPKVSVSLRMREIDLQALLKSFNVPRAGEIAARISGDLDIEARGRRWDRVDLDVYAKDDTVILHRAMINTLLLDWLAGAGLAREQIDTVLDGAFGSQDFIPFEGMRITGGLRDDRFDLNVPLRNRALDINSSYRIDRPILWEAWDHLREAGYENIRGVQMNQGPEPAAGPR